MNLRAISTSGKIVYFDISDFPVYINDRLVLLLNRKYSDILDAKTISRGYMSDDGSSMYEFDFVVNESFNIIGRVVYTDHFAIYADGNLLEFSDLENYKICQNYKTRIVDELNSVRSPIKFCANGKPYFLKRLMYGNGDRLYLSLKESIKFDSNSLRLSTNIKANEDGDEYWFDQYTEYGKVVINNFIPSVYDEKNMKYSVLKTGVQL